MEEKKVSKYVTLGKGGVLEDKYIYMCNLCERLMAENEKLKQEKYE
jgi:hypothetical protein